jgi:hypothetical protein
MSNCSICDRAQLPGREPRALRQLLRPGYARLRPHPARQPAREQRQRRVQAARPGLRAHRRGAARRQAHVRAGGSAGARDRRPHAPRRREYQGRGKGKNRSRILIDFSGV